jgi:uncharacterized membrane protein
MILMSHFAKLYVSTLIVVLALDAVWLGVLMTEFYKGELGSLARRSGDALSPIWWAAAGVYIILPLGIIWFVLPRVSDASPLMSAALWGIAFGVITYGVYDLTNYATLDKWSLRYVVVDIAWGGTICGIATLASSTLDRWLN